MTNQVAHAGVAGSGGTVALVWFWNLTYPQHPMPAEVAAAVVPMIGGSIAWIINFFANMRKTPNA